MTIRGARLWSERELDEFRFGVGLGGDGMTPKADAEVAQQYIGGAFNVICDPEMQVRALRCGMERQDKKPICN
jgi:hypothetical protein